MYVLFKGVSGRGLGAVCLAWFRGCPWWLPVCFWSADFKKIGGGSAFVRSGFSSSVGSPAAAFYVFRLYGFIICPFSPCLALFGEIYGFSAFRLLFGFIWLYMALFVARGGCGFLLPAFACFARLDMVVYLPFSGSFSLLRVFYRLWALCGSFRLL